MNCDMPRQSARQVMKLLEMGLPLNAAISVLQRIAAIDINANIKVSHLAVKRS